MMQQPICVMCRKKNDDSMLRQVQSVERLVFGKSKIHTKDTRRIENFLILGGSRVAHCKYGLHCNILDNQKAHISQIARRIAPEVVGYIKEADRAQLQKLLQLLQGYFPNAYHEVERIWMMEQKEK